MTSLSTKPDTENDWTIMSHHRPPLLTIIMVIWVVFALAAIVQSLVCSMKTGTPTQKLLGIVTAILFGPFYWIYWAVARKEECYCKTSCPRK